MLVEDDKSLREIYGVRLLAEGYDIVSAGDGEEALAMAIKERPALIITDVMMPRISGFDMLDILRSTTETKNIKVIMMTALSSEDQRRHGETLGADRYLVKSQVGIEDVVRVVHEVLGDAPGTAAQTDSSPAQLQAQPLSPPQPATQISAALTATQQPYQPDAAGLQQPTITPQPRQKLTQAQDPMVTAAQPQPNAVQRPFPPQRPNTAQPASAVHSTMPPLNSTAPSPPSARQRIIQPINDPTKKIDINSLLDKELAREAGLDPNNRPVIATTAQEKALMANQLQSAENNLVSTSQPASAQPQPQATPQQPADATQLPRTAPTPNPSGSVPAPTANPNSASQSIAPPQQPQPAPRPPIQAPQRPAPQPPQSAQPPQDGQSPQQQGYNSPNGQ